MWVLDFSQLLLVCLIVSVTNDSEFEKENCGSCAEIIFLC